MLFRSLQIGGSIGVSIGKLFKLDDSDKHILTLCGMSAVFSALFGTPITAALFSMEVISIGILYYCAFVPCLFSSVIAYAITKKLHVVHDHYNIAGIPTSVDVPLVIKVIGLAILCAVLSSLFCIFMTMVHKLFRKYFKKFQIPALTNLGTSFGMGLIVSTFMVGLKLKGGHAGTAVIVGNIAAIIGSVISVRIMLHFTKKEYGTEEYCVKFEEHEDMDAVLNTREIRDGGIGGRAIEALLEGGKGGVDVGLAIIPGVIVICTIVMMLTNGASADGTYTGAAYEGVAFLPWLGKKLEFILSPLFGFTDASAISVPITALGAAGAAIGLVPHMAEAGTVFANDVAVFTAMCMCWSGYLSTHVAMMSSLKVSKLTGKAILSHTIGGLCAGIAANWLFKLVMLFL